jgi:predicted TIM-barrel enzyme
MTRDEVITFFRESSGCFKQIVNPPTNDKYACALLKLSTLVSRTIIGADHDTIYLCDPGVIKNKEDAEYLLNCGVFYSGSGDCLVFYV